MKQKGFTLIELIMVMVLLGVLSVYATSRFSSKQSYSSTITKNQLLASLRMTQQTALSRASSASNVQLLVSKSSGNWSFVTSGGNGGSFSSIIESGVESIRSGTDLALPCSLLPASIPLTVSFDGDGNRVPQTNLRICIDSDIDSEICIAPSGYAYEGACL